MASKHFILSIIFMSEVEEHDKKCKGGDELAILVQECMNPVVKFWILSFHGCYFEHLNLSTNSQILNFYHRLIIISMKE
jgi:hypothetical protein